MTYRTIKQREANPSRITLAGVTRAADLRVTGVAQA